MTQNLCPFFGRCGGCLYQDLTPSAYQQKKTTFITRCFADHNIPITLQPLITVPLGTRRRASFSYKNGHVGYNALKSHDIIDITECRLLKPEIVAFLPELRTTLKALGGSGDVFVLATSFGLDIHIKPKQPKPLQLPQLEILTTLANKTGVVRLTYNNDPIAEKIKFPFLPDAFLQPSVEGETILINLLLSHIGSAKTAVDLFCGAGTFTKPLLSAGLSVKGYDCSDSVQSLGIHGVQRDLFRAPLLPEELASCDLIVLDPPRAGAKAQVEQIAQTQVPKIIMISCDPKTAARDIQILRTAGWNVSECIPVDQFTWSNHIELVCILNRI